MISSTGKNHVIYRTIQHVVQDDFIATPKELETYCSKRNILPRSCLCAYQGHACVQASTFYHFPLIPACSRGGDRVWFSRFGAPCATRESLLCGGGNHTCGSARTIPMVRTSHTYALPQATRIVSFKSHVWFEHNHTYDSFRTTRMT